MYRNIEIVYVKITVSFFDISLYHKIVEIAIAKEQKYMILREKNFIQIFGFYSYITDLCRYACAFFLFVSIKKSTRIEIAETTAKEMNIGVKPKRFITIP